MNKFSAAAILATAILSTGLVGCSSMQDSDEDEAVCKEIKPGTVTSVNTMCAVVNSDPVNPAVTPVEWKGQKVGFCCNGCIPKWAAMNETQKDAALAKAIAMAMPAAPTATTPAKPAAPAAGQPIW